MGEDLFRLLAAIVGGERRAGIAIRTEIVD
jgi:hypothetical protein